MGEHHQACKSLVLNFAPRTSHRVFKVHLLAMVGLVTVPPAELPDGLEIARARRHG